MEQEVFLIKSAYPRIFALSYRKECSIKEFGTWIYGNWRWEIALRRPLFDWIGKLINEEVFKLLWSSCSNGSLKDWFGGWNGLCLKPKYNRAWGTLFFCHSLEYLGSKKSSCFPSEKTKLKKIKVVDWSFSALDALKFNVNGSVRGSPGPTGMRGVLCDSGGKILCLFSSYLRYKNSNMAEILAIQKACDLYYNRADLFGRKITIVSDLKVAISWVYKEGFRSLIRVDVIYDNNSKLKCISDTIVVFNPRSSNSFTDMLARRGSSLVGDTLEWSLA
ncbi:hypothetical protein Dsin_028186 [Dipteronia sinensis]|uniref:RNase H type-1 domain-containing protein n=1 Tax=Dipteronia sinensis TaxID=43782 RepID=A0AAD9ZQ39_9ROSI|nr:hypothetical protein Dsin_028186 [Dipteronia sinensis]